MGGGTMHAHTLIPMFPDHVVPSSSSSSSSSSSPRLNNLPVPANQATPRGGSCSPISSCSDDAVFGPVPSHYEIEKALASLLDLLKWIYSSGWNLDWVQLFGCFEPRILLSSGLERVSHALHLLQTEPSFKRLVISLCSDKYLWEAIMNNESVLKLQQALLSGDKERLGISNETELGISGMSWIFDIIKEKILELIENFKLLVNEMFQPSRNLPPSVENVEQWEEKVQSSLLLSVVILLIVVLARVRGV